MGTIIQRNNEVVVFGGRWLDLDCFYDTETKEDYCYCPYHKGSYVEQFSGRLINNGVLVIVMRDNHGYHISVGPWDEDVPPPVVSERRLNQIIQEAMR